MLLKTQRKPLSPTQALAQVRAQLPTLRCFQGYSLPSEPETWIGSEVSKRNSFTGKHSGASLGCWEPAPWTCSYKHLFSFYGGWDERLWQWTAASAFFHKVLRNGVVAACRNPCLGLFSSDIHSLRWNTAMADALGRLDLFHPVFCLPSGSSIPRLAGTMKVIVHHKGFSISTSTSLQDLTRGTHSSSMA